MVKEHVLVIGGTGMLAGASTALSEKGYLVSVIGRNEAKHRELQNNTTHPNFINHLILDYNNSEKLREQLENSIAKFGPIRLVVCWCQSKEAIQVVTTVVSKSIRNWDLFHVKGSRRFFDKDNGVLDVDYRHFNVYLGFILTEKGSRWLTHQEISQGVLEAIKKRDKQYIVGTLEPWERRP